MSEMRKVSKICLNIMHKFTAKYIKIAKNAERDLM